MKENFMTKAYSTMLLGMIKEDIDKPTRKAIMKEHKAIFNRAGDIGQDNNLLTSYVLASFFIAMNRVDGLSADENIKILDKGMRKSKALKMFMGNADGYFSEKHMAFRREWSKKTHEHKYKNDWVVNVIEKDDKYEFGFDYLECGDCKLCRDEGCPELAKYLCSLDFMLVELIGVKLDRTGTLAEGADKCDFRFRKQ